MKKIKNGIAYLLIGITALHCGSKTAKPKNYDELGRQVVENLRTGNYENIKHLWPTESVFKMLARSCFKGEAEKNPAGVDEQAEGLNKYRNEIRDVIEKQVRDILPDLRNAQYISTTFRDDNDCPSTFRTNGEMKTLFAVKAGTFRVKCRYVAQTKSGDFYFLDNIRIDTASAYQ